jgi:hypothetical protein
MKKSNASAANHNPPDLEFPDWSGMDDSSRRISPDAAHRLNEEFWSAFHGQANQWRPHAPPKCEVEFDLDHPERFPAAHPPGFLDEIIPG